MTTTKCVMVNASGFALLLDNLALFSQIYLPCITFIYFLSPFFLLFPSISLFSSFLSLLCFPGTSANPLPCSKTQNVETKKLW